MKRSEINIAIQALTDFAESCGFKLPPFAHWTPQQWQGKGCEFNEIREAGLGWDITDFGGGEFPKCGLTLLTIRNGQYEKPHSKSYCEKIMLVQEMQVTPMHFHWRKTEDIINRGGGNLICKVYTTDDKEQLSDDIVKVSVDGHMVEVPAGTELVLTPGESVTLPPYLYHSFWGEAGKGSVLVGEVSAVNDDTRDNRFLDELPRFPGIQEDVDPVRLLCNEYPPATTE